MGSESNSDIEEEQNTKIIYEKPTCHSKAETKLGLIKSSMGKMEEHQVNMGAKLDRLIELKERSLRIKEEDHATNMSIKKIDLEIKSIELQMLKDKNKTF